MLCGVSSLTLLRVCPQCVWVGTVTGGVPQACVSAGGTASIKLKEEIWKLSLGELTNQR